MTLGGRLTADGRDVICTRLLNEVGGYLRNAILLSRITCSVCAAAVRPSYDRCLRCDRDRTRFGATLADLVVPVVYGVKGQQSGHLLYSYKDLQTPAGNHRILLGLLLLATLELHGPCMERQLDADIDSWATVPSARRDRPGEHPLHVIARRIGLPSPEIALRLRRHAAPDQRVTAPDRFAVAGGGGARSRHVLLIEDTWVSGANCQSAALTLQEAGAATVTILTLARWLKPEEPLTSEFVSQYLNEDYSPFRCPVAGSDCTWEEASNSV